MASLGGNTYLLPALSAPLLLTGGLAILLLTCLSLELLINRHSKVLAILQSLAVFCYACFFKAHDGDGKNSQQDALESFYKSQAAIYDATRTVLLDAREDMLCLAAAQVASRETDFCARQTGRRRVWVDVGGGTGYNIEMMAQFRKMSEFDQVYLVDFSPSLCEVARARFQRLGWDNVQVVCMDARKFHLNDFEPPSPELLGACLVTMSYSLSMMPDFHSIVDSVQQLLADDGIIAVVDFYVQSSTDTNFRNYHGGLMNRHVNLLSRVFWRTWFELDRVCLEPARRDYLEYKFGTILSVSHRNWKLGAIPYYIWLGCQKGATSLSLDGQAKPLTAVIDSKSLDVGIENLTAKIPLPPYFYQRDHWRLHYDERARKHTQFGDEYIYAFTWEDSDRDDEILRLTSEDRVLAITSAGDNILSYLRRGPAQLHAVDLNPNQNHLLELKIAAFSALPYEDFWKLFGEGKHPNFRFLLLFKLSPHLSSRAFQYWFHNHGIFTRTNDGLYGTGGSRWGIRIFAWLARVCGLRAAVKDLLATTTTIEQQMAIWTAKIRPMLLSPLVQTCIVSQRRFLWTALGVPANQLAIIEAEHAVSDAVVGPRPVAQNTTSHAIWRYVVDTFDPIISHTSIANENPYYHVCLARRYAPHCHPEYISREAHADLSRPGAFANLRIHTDEVQEVLARLEPESLSVAVVMDSMDWFEPVDRDGKCQAAEDQVRLMHRALQDGGRVMIRSAGLQPWYLDVFRLQGFEAQQVGARKDGACIDRVNMYASCWILTKTKKM